MTIEEQIEFYGKQIVWEINPKVPYGGQTTGVMPTDVTLICDDLCLKLSTSWHRSQLQNKELLITLFKKYIEEINK